MDIPSPDSLNRAIAERDEEIARLRQALEASEREKRELSDQVMRDASTGYFSRPYFRKHFADAVVFARDLGGTGAVVAAELGDFHDLASEAGNWAAEEYAARAAALLRNYFPREAPAFRYETARFAWSLLGEGADAAAARAEAARVGLEDSGVFERPARAAFAVLDLAEVIARRGTPDEAADAGFDILNRRLDAAVQEGGGRVLSTDGLEELAGLPVAYIVDPDPWHASVLAERLEWNGWEVRRFSNGASAMEALSRQKPAVVVSELAVPQGDGFALRRFMRSSSALSGIPFVLIADIKDASSVRTAADLRIVRYYKKPYFLSEIVNMLDGLVKSEGKDAC